MADLHKLQAESMTLDFRRRIAEDKEALGTIVRDVFGDAATPEKIDRLYRLLTPWRKRPPPSW